MRSSISCWLGCGSVGCSVSSTALTVTQAIGVSAFDKHLPADRPRLFESQRANPWPIRRMPRVAVRPSTILP